MGYDQRAAHPEEDVLGGVEACCKDLCRVGWVSLTDDAAGEAGDGALNCLRVSLALTSQHRVGHNEVDGILRGTADLQQNTEFYSDLISPF